MGCQFYKRRWAKSVGRALLGVLLIVFILRAGIELVCANYSVWSPDYEMMDSAELMAILDKESLTEEDYDILFEQTGITKIGIDDMLAKGLKHEIFKIQRDFFAEPEFEGNIFHFMAAMIEKPYGVYKHVPLEAGDIIYSPSTYISFYNISHTAIVVDDGKRIVEAYGYGNPTSDIPANSFFVYSEFVILRPKAGSELGKKVAEYVRNNMLDVPYDILTGIISEKAPDTLKTTHCSHLPWYAYYQCGVDIDSNGGRIVTPADILNSDELEIVQVFGMDVSDFK